MTDEDEVDYLTWDDLHDYRKQVSHLQAEVVEAKNFAVDLSAELTRLTERVWRLEGNG
jgi:hypothetical protein